MKMAMIKVSKKSSSPSRANVVRWNSHSWGEEFLSMITDWENKEKKGELRTNLPPLWESEEEYRIIEVSTTSIPDTASVANAAEEEPTIDAPNATLPAWSHFISLSLSLSLFMWNVMAFGLKQLWHSLLILSFTFNVALSFYFVYLSCRILSTHIFQWLTEFVF